MKICGIDEAGKGPVIGDLVIAGCLIEEEDEKKIIDSGAKDSKLLTPQQRENIYDKIIKVSKSEIVRISAEEIDARNRIGCNLNHLECAKMAQIINALNPDKVIIDCPHPVPEKFKQELLRYVENKKLTLVAEHKADYNYPVVGAASIIAKVTRDSHMKELAKTLGIELGSGYPMDPLTKKALNNCVESGGELNKYVRHCWNTYKDAKGKKEQRRMEDYD